LRGSGNSQDGTVLMPPAKKPHTLCTKAFGVTGVCILAKRVNIQTGAVLKAVNNDTVVGMYITGFPASGVFGYGTNGLKVVRVSAVNDGEYGISRFESTRTLFAHDTAIGNDEAGFYVGDSPHADTVVRDNIAVGNQFGVFIRHARVAAHKGSLADLDLTYGALGTYVAEREIGVDGPIREHYLVTESDTDDESRLVTEVCWPVFQTTPSSRPAAPPA
jgi:effector-binding domain-containing protein